MKLHIFTNRINHDTAHAALAFAGLHGSWQAGANDGELVVGLPPDNLFKVKDLLEELISENIPFSVLQSSAKAPPSAVPDECTPEMEAAAEKYWGERRFAALSSDPRTWKGVYDAMLAARGDRNHE